LKVPRGVGKLSHSSLGLLLHSWWFSPFWGWRGRWIAIGRWRHKWEAQLEHGVAAKNLGGGLASSLWFPFLPYLFNL